MPIGRGAIGWGASMSAIRPGDALARLATLREPYRERELQRMPRWMREEVLARWAAAAHAGQLAPPGDWRVWLIRAGRGFGKTRAGAEWVWQIARDVPGARIALVGASAEDVAKVMIEGPSGLLTIARPDEPIRYRAHKGLVELGGGGATAHVYSAEAPEKLRGPEHHAAWCDELAKWRYGDAAWDNLLMGLRLGDHPRALVTTTPRPTALMRRVMAMRDSVETIGRTVDNPHLPASFVGAVSAQYGGTRLGRQELDGELIDDAVGALWTRAMFEACRVRVAPDLTRVVVGVDPPAGLDGDACGIVACGVDAGGVGYVLEDASVGGLSPEGWARAVAACAARHDAERVVAEKNNGGEMVRSVLAGAERRMAITLVHASRGKAARAEPVAARYERGGVRHVGVFPALEDELAGLQAGGGYAGPGRSPDRADACVWALSELLLGARGAASVRSLGS